MLISISEAAAMLGVSVGTLRRWDNDGFFCSETRTVGNHRRYSTRKILERIGKDQPSEVQRVHVAYARVSFHDQKQDLIRQEDTLKLFCQQNSFKPKVISDLGSGLNMQKQGLRKLIRLICSGCVETLVITHRDRLLRFGSELIFNICEFYGTKVVVLGEEVVRSFEEQLVADVVELMTVFTARVHGKRSHKNRQHKAA